MPTPTLPSSLRLTVLAICLACLVCARSVVAQVPELAGSWIINESLSDNTDRQVEAALRASGERVQRRMFDRRKDRYRGGPVEHELYDRMSYDPVLQIALEEPDYRFTYADGFTRVVHTDRRSRSVSLTGLADVEDFSTAHWEGSRLVVESHPRDGGFTEEYYSLIDNGTRLQIRYTIKPRSFRAPIQLQRVYDRSPP